MRRPEYLSPTSMSLWAKDPSDYYLKYLSDNPLAKEQQTFPMAVGGGFDARVKSVLHSAIFGEGNDPRFAWDTLFEAQVDPQHRTKVVETSEHLLANYRRLGALDGLLLQLGKCIGTPRFEMDVRGTVRGRDTLVGGVPYFGKPDLFFMNEAGAHVILDWKVNGYDSSSGVSPMKGFVRLREDGKNHSGHVEAIVREHLGILVNVNATLEQLNEDWARQLSIYSWLCGEEVGAQFVAQVHQVVCRPGDLRMYPRIRVAEHSLFISEAFQKSVHQAACQMWEAINSDWVFRHLTVEESKERCKVLDERRATLASDDDEFSRLTR